MAIDSDIDTSKLEATLEEYGYSIIEANKINYGKQLKLNNKAIITLFTTGRVSIQGQPDEELKEILKHEGYRMK